MTEKPKPKPNDRFYFGEIIVEKQQTPKSQPKKPTTDKKKQKQEA